MCACCFTNMKLTHDLFCECVLIMMQLIMVHIHAVLVWNVCVSKTVIYIKQILSPQELF